MNLQNFIPKKESHLLLTILSLCFASHLCFAQTVNLGEAVKFALLSGNTIQGTSNVYCDGKVGATNAIDTVFRSVDSILQNNSGSVQLALTDLQLEIITLQNLSGTTIGSNLNGQTLNAGVYKISGNGSLNDTLNLIGDSSSVFVFLISDSLKIDSLAYINKGAVQTSKILFVADNIHINCLRGAIGNYLSTNDIHVRANLNSTSSLLCLNSIYSYGSFFRDINFISIENQHMSINAICNLSFDCNLVKNGNFSSYSMIPDNFSQITRACDWTRATDGTCDYFTSLSPTSPSSHSMNVPHTFMGYGYDHTYGSTIPATDIGAFSGIILYSTQGGTPDVREYLKATLFSPLTANKKYYFEMYYMLADYSHWNIDGLGALITNNNIYSPTWGVLPYTPTFARPTGSGLPLTWTRLSGCYTASGNENYIIIGNFINDANSTISVHNTVLYSLEAYSYIDDVSLVKLADAGADVVICGNATAKIGPCSPINNPDYTYSWSPATGLSSTSVSNPIANPSVTTIYTVTVSNSNIAGCSATATVKVTYHPVAIAPPIIQGSHAICIAGTYSLSNSYSGLSVSTRWYYQLPSSPALIPHGFGVTKNFLPSLFSSVSGNVNIYAVVTNTSTGCTASSSLTLYPCCSGDFDFSNQSSTAVTSIFSGNIDPNTGYFTTLPGETVFINGIFTVNNTFTFFNTDVTLGPDARIVVQGNNELHVIDGTHLYSCNGDYMWDGIYVGVPGTINQGLVYVNGGIIEDALNSVVSTNGGRLDFSSGSFNKNFKHVVIKDYAGSSSFCDIRTSYFQCNDAAGAPAVLIKPYLNFKTNIGIEINNASLVRIGDDTQFLTPIAAMSNFFKNLDYGIKAIRSSFEVYVCRFEDINALNTATPVISCGTAIFGEGIAPHAATIGSLHKNPTTSDDYTYPNEFIDCNNGIHLTKNMAGTIAYNTFNNLVNSTFPATNIKLGNSIARNYYVHDNTMSNFNVGITGNNLYSMTLLKIEKNILTGASSPFITTYGISFSNASLNKSNLLLFNNTITDCRMATYANNIDGLVMDGKITEKNMITFTAPIPAISKTYYGLWLQNCPNARINYAEVNNTGTVPPPGLSSVQGVTIENSSGTIINQCKLVNMGSGIRIKDVNTGCEMRCNKMVSCLRGVNLENANFGLNPIQGVKGTGTNGTPWDNQWISMTPYNIRVNGWVTLGNPIDWLYKNGSPSYFPGNVTNVVTPIGGQTGSIACVPLLAADENEYREEGVDEAVNDTTGNGQAMEQYYEDIYTYDELRGDSTLLDPNDSAYQQRLHFLDSLAQTAIGKFYRVRQWIDAGEIDSALACLYTVTPANLIEQNIYTTLYIYLTTYAIGLSPDSAQISTLESIAAQHVMTGGPGVYNARAMLNWEQDDAGGALRLQNLSEHITDNLNSQHPKFYPNPANNSITLPYFVSDDEIIDVAITDMLGRVLKRIQFATDEEITIDLSALNNGTFLIQLNRNNTLWFRDKVVVIK